MTVKDEHIFILVLSFIRMRLMSVDFKFHLVLSPMGAPLTYLVLIFLVVSIPRLALSCPDQVYCGNIPISYPFFTDTTPRCRGNFPIQCHGSVAMIYLVGRNLTVNNISYPDNVITIQDPPLGDYLSRGKCGFLYNFTVPIHNFHLPLRFPPLYFVDLDCEGEIHAISEAFFPMINSSNRCNDYNLYYWDEPRDPPPKAAHSTACVVSQKAASFEWKLSFGQDDEHLSLLSAGVSRQFQLREDCFYCQVTGKKYTGNNGSANPSCSWENICKTGRSGKKHVVIAVGLSVGGAFVVCLLLLFLVKRIKRLQQSRSSSLLSRIISPKISSKKDCEFGEDNQYTHIFSYQELEEATNCFDSSEELGDGGFGTVYKGKLRDGRIVAVKRLYENYRRLEQFVNEVEILSNLRHQNLVTLYGCTSRHSRELLLVYEFIPNGTLADHLHGPFASKGSLPWSVRMSIAIQTADALTYLHSVEPQIIHRDVKTTNILLDNNFNVKVADFGLSRLFPLDATHVSTAPQGTPGYVDPEYYQCYQLTEKSDVYSFGVVLVELISSKPAVDINRHRHEINLANLAIIKIENNQIDQLVDFELGYQLDLEIAGMMNQVAELAFRCLQSDREMRPCIKEVLEVLRGIESGRCKKEREEDISEVLMKEESRLLKNVLIFSPDSGSNVWTSRSTASDTSV